MSSNLNRRVVEGFTFEESRSTKVGGYRLRLSVTNLPGGHALEYWPASESDPDDVHEPDGFCPLLSGPSEAACVRKFRRLIERTAKALAKGGQS